MERSWCAHLCNNERIPLKAIVALHIIYGLQRVREERVHIKKLVQILGEYWDLYNCVGFRRSTSRIVSSSLSLVLRTVLDELLCRRTQCLHQVTLQYERAVDTAVHRSQDMF